jgi:ketosteroid isomerase-like protein
LPTPAELIEAMLAAMEAHDEEALTPVLHPDVVWWPPPTASRLLGEELPVRGREAVTRFFAGGARNYQPGTITDEIEQIIGAEPLVATVFTRRAISRRNGRPYESRYCFVIRIEHGQMAEIWEYVDTAHVFEQLGA